MLSSDICGYVPRCYDFVYNPVYEKCNLSLISYMNLYPEIDKWENAVIKFKSENEATEKYVV